MAAYLVHYQRRITSKIHVKDGCTGQLPRLTKPYTKTFYICDANTQQLLSSRLQSTSNTYVIKGSETSKNLAEVQNIYQFLLENGIDKDSVVVGVGGGVVTDLAGFVAATVLRGIDCILVPTSLLGMVDAAIGGKNGVNFGKFKNQVGTITQPRHVLVDPSLLKSLPRAELQSGMGELVKYALTLEPKLINLLEAGQVPSQQTIGLAVAAAVEMLNQDPHEQTGQRYVFNFGHTLGHAIETAANFKLSHGEAVVEGIGFALYASKKLSRLSSKEYVAAMDLIQKLGFNLPRRNPPELVAAIGRDKKRSGLGLGMVLIKGLGRPVIYRLELTKLNQLVVDYYKNIAH